MPDPAPNEVKFSTEKPARVEIRVVIWGVAGLIVLGGLYVLIAGSPTKNRAAMDSEYSKPGAMYVRGSVSPDLHPQKR